MKLELEGISKRFPGVIALDDVSVQIEAGHVHALLGENGAGKSTLIKILSGALSPDSGTIRLDGTEYGHLTPDQAFGLGISTIYQEFNLVPQLTVAENIFFGREKKKGPFLDRAVMNREADALCQEMGIALDPTAEVKSLGVAYQQIVEIAKAVSRDARILIMDEPTAPLTNQEIEALFRVIQNLRARGVAVIFITHRLDEVYRVCDRVTVLRDGKLVRTEETDNVGRADLISWMVGRSLEDTFPTIGPAQEAPLFRVRGLDNVFVRDVSFHVNRGEILGLAGLVGSGRSSVARAIFGADPIERGELVLRNKTIQVRNPSHAIQLGIGLLPEDRKREGLILGFSLKENVTYSILPRISHYGWIDRKSERELTEQTTQEVRVKTPTIDQITRNLSGGNQQKVVVAKWLATQCDLLIFDEPTRGIDVGAKQEIYTLMKQIAEQGKAIIMISSEMPELIGMAHRILVMHEGKMAGELTREEFSQQRILAFASGHEEVPNR